ncbi:MAG: formyl transferase, partial [Bacteroidales bacterium]|nr:formyl transferase [Bacteroidales bacterium]
PINHQSVSGFVNNSQACVANAIDYFPFKQTNVQVHIVRMRKIKPEVLFAVGFSQLLSSDILLIPNLGCIGFHPTILPEGRGRAPVAWLILEEKNGAASFFLIGEGADDGPVFIQSQFEVGSDDNAKSVQSKILHSIDDALDRWLPDLISGKWDPIPQDNELASYYGKRNPLDGWIEWRNNAINIDRLIRATTNPYPGAFTVYKDRKLIIWESKLENNLKIKGVTGRVLISRNDKILVQTGNGLIWLMHYELVDESEKIIIPKIKVGEKLGYNSEYELLKLKKNLI